MKEVNSSPAVSDIHIDGMPDAYKHFVDEIVALIYADFKKFELPSPSISVTWHHTLDNPNPQNDYLDVITRMGQTGTRIQITGALLDVAEGPIIPDQINRMAWRMKRAHDRGQ